MPIASGRTTAYELTLGDDGRVAVLALDRDTRRELWRTTRDGAFSYQFWGPHLVVMTDDGSVTRLADARSVVAG